MDIPEKLTSPTRFSKHFTKRGREVWVEVFFAFVTTVTLVNGIVAAGNTHDYTVLDWLINYEGGFVRRGLPGEIAFLLARLAHVSPVVFVVFFYLFFFLVFLLAMRKLALRSSLNFWVICMLISPATLSFHILHVDAGYRKEIIFLAALALFTWKLSKKATSSVTLGLLLTVGVGLGILSHELVLFYVPYLFAAVLLGGRTFKQTAALFAIPLTVGLLVAWVCVHHVGSTRTADGICASLDHDALMPKGSDICNGGPIGYLAKTPAEARQGTLATIHQNGYVLFFPVFGLLALLPLVGEAQYLVRHNKQYEVKVISLYAAMAFGASLFLFVYAVDWGRWIYIHVVSITILLLFVDAEVATDFTVSTLQVRARSSMQMVGRVVILAVYGLCWAVPNDITGKPIRMGYAGRLHEVLQAKTLNHPRR